MLKSTYLTLIVFIIILFGCKKDNEKKESITAQPDSVSGLNKDNPLLLVGTYTEALPHVKGKAEGIYVYQLNMNTGGLNYISTTKGISNPSYLAVHPNGKYVFAVSKNDSLPKGTVYAYRITENKGLREINRVSSAGVGPCFVSVDPTGKYAMAANYGDGTVALFSIAQDGSLKNEMFKKHEGKGLTTRQQSAHAHSIWPRKGGYVYAVDLGIDKVKQYRLDTLTNALKSFGTDAVLPPGSGPRHMAFHPTMDKAYVINELSGSVSAFDVGADGQLQSFQSISAVGDYTGKDAGSADIHITPDGQYLYASNRGKFNNIAMFSIDDENGELTLIGNQSTKGRAPRNFVIDPTGKYLLVANQNSDNVVTFQIDANTGKLIDLNVESEIPTPVCLKFMDDNF